MNGKLKIGSRGSDLALWQTNFVKKKLEDAYPALSFEVKIITTTGDQMLDTALSKIGDKGLFTRQIENALLNGEIDLAVHSLKDLQTAQPVGLTIGAVLERETPNDVLLSSRYNSIDELPKGARVATGSLRRKSQLLHYRPDLSITEIRGNVPTRIRKLDESELDGMILAYAGVHRLGLDSRIRQVIPFGIMLPAVGQGAMAVEVRADDTKVREIASVLDDTETRNCVTAERAFLRRLEGGCQVPIGAMARVEGDRIYLEGVVGSLDGDKNLRERITGDTADADALGTGLAEQMLEKGAAEILEEGRRTVENPANAVVR
ncbi:MAG TPA: hydroxymethylbilane synthase [Pyrinomonadaceae bacterium]|jgi:hydroxymethylbilane synthase|nr:hydroxymethylbilane synthase [Pyrinomonadaceae bacterium]